MHPDELVTPMTLVPVCVPGSERSVVSTDTVQSQALSLVSADMALSPLPPEGDCSLSTVSCDGVMYLTLYRCEQRSVSVREEGIVNVSLVSRLCRDVSLMLRAGRWAASARATCAARKAKLVRNSTSDIK